MGGGKREYQIDQRFDQAGPEWTKEKGVCKAGGEILASYGLYELWKKEEGIELRKDGEILGVYPKAVALEDNRALLKLDKGMLLEVTDNGAREIFSGDKSLMLSLIASDGNLVYDTDRHSYLLRFGSKSDELRAVFKESMEETYGLTPHEYQHKDREHFFEMVKGSKEAAADAMNYINKHGDGYWEVPSKYMDKEAARAWLKGFMSGDGSIGYYPRTNRLSVRLFSKNREGLEGLADLMEEHFGIASVIYLREGGPSQRKDEYTLAVNVKEDMVCFIEEIGSFKRSHQEAIERFWEAQRRRRKEEG